MRTPLLAIAWTRRTSRAAELAEALNGTAFQVDGAGLRGRYTAPLRWSINAVATVAALAWFRPRAVLVQNPPIFPAGIVWLYSALTKTPFLLDSHPASFGRKGSVLWRIFLPMHRALMRRATMVLVTVHELAEEVTRSGGTPAIVHEAPPRGQLVTASRRPAEDPTRPVSVLFICVFASDEPVEAVVEAARQCPELEFTITGATQKAAPGLIDTSPDNVTYSGFLGVVEYQQAIAEASLVLCLTTEATSVMRSAYEAVYAGRPLVVSDHPVLREVFPYAGFTAHDPPALAATIRATVSELPTLLETTGAALELQEQRWATQIAPVSAALVRTAAA